MTCTGGKQFANIEIAPFDGTKLGSRQVLVASQLTAQPTWAPDSKSIVYFAPQGVSGHFQLWQQQVRAEPGSPTATQTPPPTSPATPSQGGTGGTSTPTPGAVLPPPVRLTSDLDFDATSTIAWRGWRKLERSWSARLRKSKFPAPSDASRMAECAPDKVRSRSRGTRPRPGQSLSAAGAPARVRGQQLRTRAAHASRGRGGPPRERPGRCSVPAKPRGPRQPHLRHAPDRRPPPVMRDLRQQSGSPHRGILSLQRRRGGTMEVGATTPGQLVLGLTDQVMAEGPEATRFFVDHAGRCDRPEPGLQLVHVDAKHSTQRTNLERSAQDCRSRERFTANRGAP
jgi:hypothetical protein